MDYQKCYDLLIETRRRLNRNKNKEIYYENHHIILKSMGGLNTKENLVLLTPKEHFLAHWLLYRIYQNRETSYAFFRMCMTGNKNMERYIPSSRIYEEARISYIKLASKKVVSQETRDKLSRANKGKKRTSQFSIEVSKRMREGQAKKIGEANKGISRGKGISKNKGIKHGERNKNLIRIKWGRPINTNYSQYDLKGNLIHTIKGWNNLIEYLKKQKLYIRGVNRSIKNNKSYKNYIWKIN